jgi:hypothetical protein
LSYHALCPYSQWPKLFLVLWKSKGYLVESRQVFIQIYTVCTVSKICIKEKKTWKLIFFKHIFLLLLPCRPQVRS